MHVLSALQVLHIMRYINLLTYLLNDQQTQQSFFKKKDQKVERISNPTALSCLCFDSRHNTGS